MKYEKPSLINLNSDMASGLCITGTGDRSGCANGPDANPTGCQAGASAAFCVSGAGAPTTGTSCGTGDAPSS